MFIIIQCNILYYNKHNSIQYNTTQQAQGVAKGHVNPLNLQLQKLRLNIGHTLLMMKMVAMIMITMMIMIKMRMRMSNRTSAAV